MLLRLYNDDTPLQDHSKERFNRKPGASNEEVKDDDVEIKVEEDVMEDSIPQGTAGEDKDAHGELDDTSIVDEMTAVDGLPVQPEGADQNGGANIND